MAAPDIEFFQGDFGDNYDISLYNADGTVADITGYTAGTLTIKTYDRITTKLSAKAISIVIANPALVRWAMASGDTDYNDENLLAQIELTGTSKVKKTFFLKCSAYAVL